MVERLKFVRLAKSIEQAHKDKENFSALCLHLTVTAWADEAKTIIYHLLLAHPNVSAKF